jgi:hypothetical protein
MVARTANSEQGARLRARSAGLERARARRVALDQGRIERDARIDAAVADVFQAQDERSAAVAAVGAADIRIGRAIARLAAEGVTTAQVAELCAMTVTAVQRLKGATMNVAEGRTSSTEQSDGRASPSVRTDPAA